ncbi:MAG: hypothetical protein ISR91_05645 [Candidatus Delongbacteria bacterium]|nr:hypothetical protein [Candidatus Delongbacteria bacterium]
MMKHSLYYIALLAGSLLFTAIMISESSGSQPAMQNHTSIPAVDCFSQSVPGSQQHRITLDLFPATHQLVMSDTLFLPAGINEFLLNRHFNITHLSAIDQEISFTVTPAEEGEDENQLNRINLTSGSPGPLTLIIAAEGELFESTSDVSFSHENVGREISATVSDEGIYLSSAAGWYPLVDAEPGCFQVTVSSPESIECLTDGRLIRQEVAAGRQTAVWRTLHPTDGLILIGGLYHINSRETAGGQTVYTWFLADDPQLTDTYLTQSVRYIEMYSQLLSNCPYDRFTVVENFFPTGYGMPGWTLLGGDIIRLPFIPYTSLGHEILHNWWGNSVFVDDSLGNWCEGITVYQADYLYKLQKSAADARRYRKDALKQFTSYVTGENDLPLVEFRERHNPATRAIGYGKYMMLFHMIEEIIGPAAFQRALQEVIARNTYQRASFADFIIAFSGQGGRDLEPFVEGWLHQLGAARLELGTTDWDGSYLTMELHQTEPVFQLELPVRLTTATGVIDTTLAFSSVRSSFSLPVAKLQQLEIDPDYHTWRYLWPAEMEPSMEQALADPTPFFIAGANSSSEAVELFANAISEAPATDHFLAAGTPLPGSGTCYLINPVQIPAGISTHFEISGNQVSFEDQDYNLDEATLVLVERISGEVEQTVVFIFTNTDPTRLGKRLQHYGKYSWLVFQEGRNSGKGYWPVTDSPLTRSW